ncbi:MAG: hypothetical protein C4583_04385 [Anaerolineaceae bacterium]|nr:MAG: hypothetical protein C4583_04385 [Anaerolineaceae bacterium]
MTTIATLAVKLIADAAAFTQAMDAAERTTQTWSGRVSQSMKSVGGDITNLGMKATTFLTLPMAVAGMAAINYASDLEETKNKVMVVFGEMSGGVLDWSTTSAQAMGMSQNTALSAAGTFGNLFTTMGLGQDASADMSMGLVQLASDLASFNNMDPTEVLEKLRSGLVGEVEPLRTLGINLSQTAVEAKAMEMGLAGADGSLTAAALAQARYALILEQSANAAGDFARTSDGLANQQRILKAEFENAAAALGVQLLPYALQFVQWLSGLIEKFQALSPEQQKWIIGIGAALAILGPLLVIIGTLITALGAIIGVIGAITVPVLIVIAVIAALIAIGYLLYRAWTENWGGIQEKTRAGIDFVKGILQAGMQFMSDFTAGKLGFISQAWHNTWELIKLWFNTAVENIKSIFRLFSLAFQGDWHGFGEELRKIWDRNWKLIGEVLKTAWNNIKIIVKGMIDGVINFFTTTDWGHLGRMIAEGIVNGLMSMASWALNQIVSFGQAIADVLAGFFGIHSESKLMHDYIGTNLALGTIGGWNDTLTPNAFTPALATATTTALDSAPAIRSRSDALAEGGIIIQFSYSPAVSLGDRYEAEQVLAPMIADAVRRRLEQEA